MGRHKLHPSQQSHAGITQTFTSRDHGGACGVFSEPSCLLLWSVISAVHTAQSGVSSWWDRATLLRIRPWLGVTRLPWTFRGLRVFKIPPAFPPIRIIWWITVVCKTNGFNQELHESVLTLVALSLLHQNSPRKGQNHIAILTKHCNPKHNVATITTNGCNHNNTLLQP